MQMKQILLHCEKIPPPLTGGGEGEGGPTIIDHTVTITPTLALPRQGGGVPLFAYDVFRLY